MPSLPAEHKTATTAKRHEVINSTAARRLRGRKLQERNARILQRDPLCKRCLAKTPPRIEASVEVDHDIPLHKGGTDHDSNLSGICHACHSEKTAKENAVLRGYSKV